MKIQIRPIVESDHAFIFATYLRNKWFDKGNKTTLKRSTWSKLQHKRIEDLMHSESAKNNFLVACLEEDPDVILGYAFTDGQTPFVYVKLPWRSEELGIASKLLKEIK
jgi:DNA polymerase elongation subunit (family B)